MHVDIEFTTQPNAIPLSIATAITICLEHLGLEYQLSLRGRRLVAIAPEQPEEELCASALQNELARRLTGYGLGSLMVLPYRYLPDSTTIENFKFVAGIYNRLKYHDCHTVGELRAALAEDPSLARFAMPPKHLNDINQALFGRPFGTA